MINSNIKVIDETLSPTWDELLVFGKLLVYGRKEDIKRRPPLVTVEIYDYDKVQVVAGTILTFKTQVVNNPHKCQYGNFTSNHKYTFLMIR